jgi:hypothetical protein
VKIIAQLWTKFALKYPYTAQETMSKHVFYSALAYLLAEGPLDNKDTQAIIEEIQEWVDNEKGKAAIHLLPK